MSSHDALTERGDGRPWRDRLRLAWRSLRRGFSGPAWTRRGAKPGLAGRPGPASKPGLAREPGPGSKPGLASKPGPPRKTGPTARQVGRRLGPIEQGLTRESPALAGLFGVFTQLAEGEPADGLEQLPVKPPWPRPRPAAIAVLLALASVVALCLTLSAHVSPAPRSCVAASGPAPVSGATATLNGTAVGRAVVLNNPAILNDGGIANGVPCGRNK